jgi:hypothetical protein
MTFHKNEQYTADIELQQHQQELFVKNSDEKHHEDKNLLYYGENDMKLNLSTLHGLRCLTCFSLVPFHIHLLHGIWYYISESSCYHAVYQSLFGFLFLRASYQMSLFWMISGFLCEYQLHQMYIKRVISNKDKNQEQQGELSLDSGVMITTREYLLFFCNRIMRLYPLYALVAMISFVMLNADQRQSVQFTTRHLLQTLLFVRQWNDSNVNVPSAQTWSVQVDVHGYIAIILLFAWTCRHTYRIHDNTMQKRIHRTRWKRYILFVWYIMSLIRIIFVYQALPWQTLSPEEAEHVIQYGAFGMDRLVGLRLQIHDFVYGDRTTFYPYYDFNSTFNQAMNTYVANTASNTYLGSIMNHGVAMMLGSLLYLNLYIRNGKQSNPMIKLLLCIVGLILTQGWYGTAAVPVYFFLDAVLTMNPHLSGEMKHISTTKGEKQVFVNPIVTITPTQSMSRRMQQFHQRLLIAMLSLLSHSYFKILSEYTYGIYLFHMYMIVLFDIKNANEKMSIIKNASSNNHMDACIALHNAGYTYNTWFMIQGTVICSIGGTIIAYILNIILERPVNRFRKRIIMKFSSSASSSSTSS